MAAETASAGRELRELMSSLQAPAPASAEPTDEIEAALAACKRMYNASRSHEALPLARAALALANDLGDSPTIRRCSTAAGLLCGDTGDVVSAIEYHLRSLRLAAAEENRVEMSGIWNNIGVAATIAGNVEMAARCYKRSLALVEKDGQAVYARFAALCNLANCGYKLGNFAEGLEYGQRSLREMTPQFENHDRHAAVLLRRNLVRLLVACSRSGEAAEHVAAASAMATSASSPRARIAAETTRATLELATGQADIALTRLDRALADARLVPAAVQDTLICMIRAEEDAGNAARALLHLEELSEHVYRSGIAKARSHIEAAGLRDAGAGPDEQARQLAKARLISKLPRPAQPDGWKSLQRLGVSAVLRMDDTGWHGVRVGALTKALALFRGMPGLQAIEIGLAAELHDIGMMAVPEGLLSKPDPLNAAEHAIVMKHVQAGAEALADAVHPRMLLARDIAHYHHASWDGTGHPARVGGDFIPLAARMCAIADAYDAMLCGIGSRKARSMGEALDELRRCAGTQFDPELVASFEDMIRCESKDLGLDLESGAGMDHFQELVMSLKEDRGFL